MKLVQESGRGGEWVDAIGLPLYSCGPSPGLGKDVKCKATVSGGEIMECVCVLTCRPDVEPSEWKAVAEGGDLARPI